MIQTYNQHVVKQRNKSLILNSIKYNNPISRAALANQTGLNKGTVSSLVSELIEEELILESGPGISSGGRRPVMLLFNQAAGYSIGIDIGVNYVLAILTDLQGKICHEKQIKIHNLNFSDTLAVLFKVIDDIYRVVPKSPYGIVGIGIGVPGTVSKEGEILLAPNLNWKNINLKEVIEQKYNLPVTIHNEANAGAYGEKKFGAGQEFNNLIYISGGIGIGVGLILNNQLYLGQNGLSGELGHMTIDTNGPTCNCGSKGCWELFASEKALLRLAENEGVATASSNSLSLESLIKLAESSDEKTIKLFQQLGKNLAVGLKNIINIFNPEQIIIGNRLAALQKWIEEELKIQLDKSSLSNHQANIKLQFSELEKRSAALGVAAFSTENFIKIHLDSN